MTTLNVFSAIFAVVLVAVNSQEVVKEQCTQKSDVAFVVDSSGSISRRNFQKELEFVKEVASTFKMGPDQSQIAVISYSDDAQIDIKFGDYSNVNDFNAAVDGVKHQRQRTRIDKALHLAATSLFTPKGGARPNVAKVMIILTDGKQTVTSDSKTLDVAVRPLQQMNVTIFAVGVGKAIDIGELLLLVGDNVDNLFRAQNFNELAKDSVRVAAQTCKRIAPPIVHGNWSAWAVWGDCSQTCGGGVQGRQRSCTNPPPKNGGADCSGKSTEVRRCNTQGCPVNGSWSEWSDWGSCSLTCGEGGVKKRTRTCTNPPPTNGGLDCVGPPEETSECNVRACPVDGSWSEWQEWNVCTRSCGTGIQIRARTCDNPRPAHGGKQCPGASGETRSCNTQDCPVDGNWSGWKPWGPCTKSCGGGSQNSSRTCTNPPPTNGGKECRGENERSRVCNTQPCPVDGKWSSWAEWSICTTSCGVGTQRRFRTCSNPRPAYGGQECNGSRIETRNCNRGSCPVDGSWSNWEEWGSCSKSCGGGVQKRVRGCTNPPPANGGRDCIGRREQTQACNQNACPVDGEWSRWTEWTSCSRTCGIGEKKRSRTCTNPRPANGGKDCEGPADETRECSNRICPVDGEWSGWKDWAPCSVTCGTGTQERERTCTKPRPAFGGKDCVGVSRESKSCQAVPCPVDGEWSEWKDWTPCSKTCGTGTQERERSCTRPRPAFGGKDCIGDSQETKSCQARACPVHGDWTPWAEWSTCSKTCGSGTQTRQRRCENPRPEHGGRQCEGPSEQARMCNTRNCPVDGQWSDWKEWTECTRTCGGGVQTRARTCTRPSPAHGGKDCVGRGDETRPCGTDSCPVDGNWSEWTEWRECSRSCGGGLHSRTRTCTNPPPRHGGKDCSGKPDQTRPCNTQSCPVDGQWSSWTVWTPCSKSCGKGEQKRSRTCTNPPPVHGGKQCSGEAQQTQDCNAQSCAGCLEIADIAFLVDASESMTKKDFENEKEVIKKIAATFDVGQTKSHLGLISFSTDAHIRVKFGDHLDLHSFQDAVDKIPFAAGGTRFDKAFGVAANGLFSASGGVRPDIPKVLIILTDGKQSADYDAVPIERSVLPLRHLGVRIFALAIGSQVDMSELRQIVNDPKDIHAVKDFDELLNNVKEVGNKTCEIITRPEVLCVEKADIAFLMDASESMTEDDFEKQKSFVTKVAESFHMAPKTSQFALVTYSSTAKLHIRFRDHLNQDTFNTVVKQLPFAAGGTRFDKALKLAAEEVFTKEGGARSGVPKVMIILTDGRQSQDYDAIPLQQAVLPLHQMSVQIHAVAIGSQVNRVELRKLVQKEEDIFSIKDFDNLVNKSRQLASKTCDIITRPPPVKQCTQKSDVAFVVDSSGSISRRNFQKELEFVKEVASTFKMGPDQSQIAVISYSDDAQIDIKFGDYSNVNDFNAAVDGVKHQRQRTRIDKALHLAATSLFTPKGGARPNVAKVMIILTDGKQTVTSDSKTLDVAVRPLQEMNVTIFAVGVGKAIDIGELLLLVGDNVDNLFRAQNFNELAKDSVRVAAQTCKRIAPPIVHGNWSAWAVWGDCSQTCGGGVQGRQRSCTNPPPKNGGADCSGKSTEVRRCNTQGCPVNGSWSEWSDWGSCSLTCGEGGVKKRSRTCTNPPPTNGGLDCVGPTEETSECNVRACPVDGSWSEWQEWNACTRSCGTGIQIRARTCDNPRPAHGGKQCPGASGETRSCNTQDCPVDGNWSGWKPWGPCTKSCGGGSQNSSRTCTNPPPTNGGKECRGENERSRVCNTQPCPVDGKWSSWAEWSICTTSCGVGTQRRFRTCSNPRPAYGGQECNGSRIETRNCNRGSCPVDGSWSNWEEWGSCSKSCGGGVQKRVRGCTNPPPANGGRDCIGRREQTQACNQNACPVDGEWSRWTEWTSCSRTCGIGEKKRSRTCTNPRPANGGKDCEGPADETRECSNRICPVDGEWSDWKDWAPCSVTCGTGTQERERTCTKPRPAFGGKDCVGVSGESKSCQAVPCPVDGEWSEWKDWTPCSTTCGTGTQERERSCTRPRPAFGGKDCIGDSQETKSCQARACPVHGDWTPWAEWSTCSKTCGSGTQTRQRRCENPRPEHGGRQCEGPSEQARMCNTRNCPVDGQWSDWKEWTECTRTCGGGVQTRARTCTRPSPAHGGKDCVGRGDETRPCGTDSCPVDGNWSEWTEWRECSRSCGGGLHSRTRTCTNPPPRHGGKDCSGKPDQTRPCNTQSCPVNGNWSEWTEWRECSRSCGGGLHSRSRTCTNPPPRHGGEDCSGKPDQTRPCNTQSCPVDGQWSSWTVWTPCSKSCGKGEQKRSRTCTNPPPVYGGKQCSGEVQQTQDCNAQSCAGCSEIADIAFLVDASESMTKKDFENEKEVIKKIAATFDVGQTKSHLGLISFSTDAHIRVKFGDHLDLRSFQDAVDKIPFAAGGTRFDKAFGVAANGLFSASGGVRSDLPKVLIILTDGKQSADYDAIPIERSVLPLRHLGVRIVALAIGSQVDMSELRQIVNDPKDIHAVKDFDELLDNVREVGNKTCEIITRPEVLCVEKADIAFLMDASESMTEGDFEKQKSFVTKVAESFHMAPKTSQFALVTYSSTAKLHIRFRDHLNQDTFNTVVKQLPFAAGGTRFDKALKLAAEEVFTKEGGARSGVPKVMIILTDGRQSQDYDAIPLQQAVLPLHQMSVQIHAVAIGSQVNRVELRKLVQKEEDIFSIKDFDNLVNKSRQLASKTCDIITRPPPVVKCSDDADLAFVVDTSGSISDENFKKQKDFVKVLASSFDPTLAQHQLGLISYSSDAQMEVSFQDKADRKEFERAVDLIPHTKGRTRLDKALKLASSQLFTSSGGSRSGKRKIMIILTDGRQSQDPDTVALKVAVLPLKQLGVRVYTVAIGDEVDLKELHQVTERNEDVFPVSDFADLANMANDIALKTCRVRALSQGHCNERINLAFVMDMSSSITSKNYPKEKDFVKNVADTFSISRTQTTVGVVTYNRDAKLWISFGQHDNNEDFKKAVDDIPYWGGSTRIDNGLDMAAVELFSTLKGDRAKLPNVLILLTDGKQNSDPRATPLEEAVLPLFQLGVKVFAVGVGDQISRDELRLIVEKDQDIFTMKDFDDLLAKSHQIARATCDEVKANELSLQGLAGTYKSCFKNVDIGFVIDSSDSATSQEYQHQKELVQRLSSYYDISKQDTRVGVVVYSDKAFTTVGMNSYKDSSILRRAVGALPRLGGGNRKDKALVTARRMFKARRPSSLSGSAQASQVLVFFTEGAQTGVAADRLSLEHAVHPLRRHGVRVIVVGVGRQVVYQELRSIAQDPHDIYLTASLDDVDKEARELLKIICK
ncbi:SCO-spondin-like [Oculina patagonica]